MRKAKQQLSHEDVFLNLYRMGKAHPVGVVAKVSKSAEKSAIDGAFEASLYLEYETGVFQSKRTGSAEIACILLPGLDRSRGERLIDRALFEAREDVAGECLLPLTGEVLIKAELLAFEALLDRREMVCARLELRVANIAHNMLLISDKVATLTPDTSVGARPLQSSHISQAALAEVSQEVEVADFDYDSPASALG